MQCKATYCSIFWNNEVIKVILIRVIHCVFEADAAFYSSYFFSYSYFTVLTSFHYLWKWAFASNSYIYCLIVIKIIIIINLYSSHELEISKRLLHYVMLPRFFVENKFCDYFFYRWFFSITLTSLYKIISNLHIHIHSLDLIVKSRNTAIFE